MKRKVTIRWQSKKVERKVGIEIRRSGKVEREIEILHVL